MDEKKDLVWTWQMLRQIFWDVQPLRNESLGRDILDVTKIMVDGTYEKNKRLGRVHYMNWGKGGYWGILEPKKGLNKYESIYF